HLYCVFEQCKRALEGRRFIVTARWCKGKIPVAFRADLPILIDQDVGSRELQDVLEECVRCGNVAVYEIFIKGDGIDFARYASFENGFDLRAKDQFLPIPVVIQGLLAKAIASSQEDRKSTRLNSSHLV